MGLFIYWQKPLEKADVPKDVQKDVQELEPSKSIYKKEK